MGKRILISGLIALLLVAGVSAWLVLNPPWQGNRSGASASESGTPDATAHRPLDGTQGRQVADATSVQTDSRAGSEGAAGGTNSPPSAGNSRPGQPGGTSSARPSAESAGKPAMLLD
ncbi:MAG: hypothetical protein KBG84_06545 [Planctomycetes bacterium]|nr:hypothetical protein [Planctomycetota bacterium]